MEKITVGVEKWDVIAVGAGVGGLVAAIAAARAGSSRVLVLDKAPDIKETSTSRSGGSIAVATEP